MIPSWMQEAAARAEDRFARNGIRLTLGGEPTFVPIKPEGPEWSYSAVGPTKLAYAWKVAGLLQKKRLRGAAAFFCPGKLYPGEVNPRWAVRLLANRDGSPLFRPPAPGPSSGPQALRQFATALSKHLGVASHWVRFSDPRDPRTEVFAMPLDHDEETWTSAPWPLDRKLRTLINTEGAAGLRLPLQHFPPSLPRRALTIERTGNSAAIFFPPLLQRPFLELLAAAEAAAQKAGLSALELQGYLPLDEAARWTVLGLTADPGVLEINLPACTSWTEYAGWLETLTSCCASAGLRSWKNVPQDHPQGSGGGNHLLWGGPSIEAHPFFARPKWLAAILRFWQHHPSLAYLFTGCYVGASSQAPRPDESARDLYDIDMAYTFLEGLPEGDHRELINETLRHLQTDTTGNSHRSEISFDKFWNTSLPSGALGLIEFRAIESLPRSEWMSAIALLWHCLAAHLLDAKIPRALKPFGPALHDEYFLPQRLWEDLEEIFSALEKDGFPLERKVFQDIWKWRFPSLLVWNKGPARLTVRKALESWPLLCETPVEGGSTSRFVDTSMQRLEFSADAEFFRSYHVHVAGRPLAIRETSPGVFLAGLRFRRTNLYPALHPGIPVQLPLHITLVNMKTGRVAAEFELKSGDAIFHKLPKPGAVKPAGNPCRGRRKSDLTCDLRLD